MLLTAGQIHKLAEVSSTRVNSLLMTAICLVESNGNPWACRFEPGYRWTIDPATVPGKPLVCTNQTELQAQMFSYGLCQLMGATARDLGFDGWLSELFDPVRNLFWGCKLLERLMRKYADTMDVIASYNAGSPRKITQERYSNQGYVDKVLGRMQQIREECR